MFYNKINYKKYLWSNLKNVHNRDTNFKSFYQTNYLKKYFSVIGLDMGGTNTCIAVIEPNGPRVIENAEGLRTTPSYVSFSEDGTEFVAVAAKRISIQNLYRSFYGTKFFFGHKYSDEFIQKLIKRFPFKIEKGPNDEIYFSSDINKQYTPSAVSTMYLKYVREQGEALIGKPVKKIVMSIPKYIPEKGKDEIKFAVKECGMDVAKFIDESVASAYAYNCDKNEKANNIIVFNFGGLNFSLTYLEKNIQDKRDEEADEKEIFEIKYEAYDYFLGGEDIDQLITKYLLNEFERINKMDIKNDLYALQRVRDAAEKAKVELSLSQQAEISLPFLAADQSGPKHLNIRISRSKFETLIDPVITQLKTNCENFLKNNNINTGKIDDILLVGGISRVPRVQEIIKQVFGREGNKSINPEEAPSMGASILASRIKLKIDEIKTMDSLPLSVGIETLGGNFAKIIERGTPLPLKISKTITTAYENQPKIDIKFFMGERGITSENKFLGSFSMIIPLLPKGESRIQVTITINTKGDLLIQATEELSKKTTSFTTKINTGLTQEIIEEVLEVSSKLKESDKAQNDLINLKIEADSFIYTIEKLIRENNEILEQEEHQTDVKKIQDDIIDLNELLKGEEFEKIIDTYQVLQKDFSKLENIVLNKEN